MFDTNLCLAYARQLPDHIKAFFEEMYQKSNHHRERFVAEAAAPRFAAPAGRAAAGFAGRDRIPPAVRPAFRTGLEQMQQKLS
uniref:Uncharacterized protein n=1 Tax=Anopheles quadriannulatus TaxID=34691 RepID=A0A182XPX1_ANOQN